RNHNQSAHEGFCSRHRIVSAKLYYDAALMKPESFQSKPAPVSPRQHHSYQIESFKPAGEVRLHTAGRLAPDPTCLYDPGDNDVLGVDAIFAGTFHYSRISSTNRFFTFMPAALNMVLIALAVRPCLPMTLPRSC